MSSETDESVLFIEVSSIQRCPDRERDWSTVYLLYLGGHVTKGVLIERLVHCISTLPWWSCDWSCDQRCPDRERDSTVHVSFRDLQELKEQFTTYRKEKGENDVMIGQQLETLRQEASALRMNNVKITAKVYYI